MTLHYYVITAVGQEDQTKSWMRDVVLLVDAMALHKMTIYDKAKNSFVGMVDYGTAIPESETNEATEASVFMIIGLTGNWKHPVAYVLQDKCTANVQAQMIKDCIGLLNEQGLQVHGLAFDGTFTNQQTAVKLGCKMNASNPQPWFPHPQWPSSKVHIIFDVCHMVKLMRICLVTTIPYVMKNKGT